jgi:hypothetical protein
MDKEESESKRIKPNPKFDKPISELTHKQLGHLFWFGSKAERDEAERVATERRNQGFYTRSKQKDGGKRRRKTKRFRRNRK